MQFSKGDLVVIKPTQFLNGTWEPHRHKIFTFDGYAADYSNECFIKGMPGCSLGPGLINTSGIDPWVPASEELLELYYQEVLNG